jgi:hypothetical protein
VKVRGDEMIPARMSRYSAQKIAYTHGNLLPLQNIRDSLLQKPVMDYFLDETTNLQFSLNIYIIT